ncbi:type VI secretion system Vgr family protein [Pantoea sp. GD03673]|uniref:type VI secretion system Vgr family protein n=1 Tax=Pantoea sp. GD03673 TaxID=2975364 RepID=UPI00244C9F0C|nr:type VI secretion system Vgr family protein [Pantoea sp. GD03673]MDH2066246.1 type VI secretion system tip protein VgrG [Pantoea sp. GD03673]
MSEILVSAAQKMTQTLGHSRYLVSVHDCPHTLDVLNFHAEEALSEPWRYVVTVTCDSATVATEAVLLKPATFTFQQPVFTGAPALPVRQVYGVVHSFRRLSTSADETRYRLTLVPRLALLRHTRRSEIYLNMSVPEVVEQVLRSHQFEGPDFGFRLTREYPQRELITQWRETDLQFMQRLLAEVGIFWRFEMDNRLGQDVVIFLDSQQHYQQGMRLPVHPASGLTNSGLESIERIETHNSVVSARVATRDYNYREALVPQDSTQSVTGPEGITTGEVYHYAEPFLSEGEPDDAESGAFFAQLRHERLLSDQQQACGKSNSAQLTPGQVLESGDAFPAGFADGIVITRVRSKGSRSKSFSLHFDGVPYSDKLCWRPALIDRPIISGTLPARVESTDSSDLYAWLDNTGRYRVRLDFDRNAREAGYSYLWLRLAKPYAGPDYGWHAPLLAGTEVSVAFDSGDPDRPYIAHAQHDSEHADHVTRDNHSRNVLRTPANNKLRMEDLRQQEHIKLATEYGKSQISLGHIVDAQRKPRGRGFELRTDERGAVRAGSGLFLTADEQPKAQGEVLAMQPALNNISAANEQMQALNNAAQAAQALTCDISAQLSLAAERLKGLQSAVLLASAPQGVALTSGEHLQLTSGRHTFINAGKNLNVGAIKNLSLAAEQALGLFAHKQQMSLIANQGDVVMQAQHNSLNLNAAQQLTVTSTDDDIIISTPKTLTLNGGGSYLKLSGAGIEHGSEGKMIMNVAQFLIPGSGADLPVETPDFKHSEFSLITRNVPKWASE